VNNNLILMDYGNLQRIFVLIQIRHISPTQPILFFVLLAVKCFEALNLIVLNVTPEMLRYTQELLVITVLLTGIIPGKEKSGKQENAIIYLVNSYIFYYLRK